MTVNMHCRLSCLTDDSIYPLTHSHYTNISNRRTHSPQLSYHDQIPSTSASLRRFRRLEDPISNFASNYYVLHPPSPTLERIHSKSNETTNYCDLFNLLENSPTIKSQRKQLNNESNSFRRHRSIVYKNMHTKFKDFQERKRHYSQHEHLPSKKTNGFFRRVVRQYFCMPMTLN